MKKYPKRFSKRIFKKYWDIDQISDLTYIRYESLINRNTKRHRNRYPMSYRFLKVAPEFRDISVKLVDGNAEYNELIDTIHLQRRGLKRKRMLLIEINYMVHGSMAIVDFVKNRIEYFNSWYDESYNQDIENIFLSIPEFTDMEFVCLNKHQLQVGEPNCFVWPWLYLHYKFKGQIDNEKILEYFLDMENEDRQNVAYRHFFGEQIRL